MKDISEIIEAINQNLAELFAEPLLRSSDFMRAPEGRRLRRPLQSARIAIFEQVNDVRLPDDYKHFLARVGDGGIGPGYGLYELSSWRSVELPGNLIRVTLPEGEHRALNVVDHGGTDVTVLLLSGRRAGQLVELTAGGSPRVCPEPNFLEWYLTWLATAARDLETDLPRAEDVLVRALSDLTSEEERAAALHELGAVPDVTDETVALVEQIAKRDPSSQVRYRAIELLGDLEPPSMEVFLVALRDPKRSIRRRALVHLLRFAGDTAAWDEGLAIVRSESDAVSVELADMLDSRRVQGMVIPQELR